MQASVLTLCCGAAAWLLAVLACGATLHNTTLQAADKAVAAKLSAELDAQMKALKCVGPPAADKPPPPAAKGNK